MNTAETYLFAEYQSKIKALNYTVGIGAMRTYNSQEQYSSEKYIVKPSLSLSYSINWEVVFQIQRIRVGVCSFPVRSERHLASNG